MNLVIKFLLFTVVLLTPRVVFAAGGPPDDEGSNSAATSEPGQSVVQIWIEPGETELADLDEHPTAPEVSALTDWNQGPTLSSLADQYGWDNIEYYSTIQVLALYESIWLFARGPDGMKIYNYNHTTDTWGILPILPDLADSNNWGSDPKYYSTIRVIVFYNNFCLLARNADGLQVYQFDPLPNIWTTKQALPNFSDANGWDNEEFYSTIRAFSLSSKIWVFARGPAGEEIHQYDPDIDYWQALPTLSALSDAGKWGTDPKYYSTIQVLRLGPDFWLLGRGATGIRLFQYSSVIDNWAEKPTLFELSDGNGWGKKERYSTIRTMIFQSYIWLFARDEFGVQTYYYDPEKDAWTTRQPLTNLSDANNWDTLEYLSTIQIVALNNSIALLARSPSGLEYYEYFPITDTWKYVSAITSLSDANNWDNPEYYDSIRSVNYLDAVNVFARGPTGMEVYNYID